jgi:thioredoxin reductase
MESQGHKEGDAMIYDLAVVGGGPAALAATFYALEKRLSVLMIYDELGGQIGWRERLVSYERDQQQLIEARQQHARQPQPEALPPLPANALVRVLIERVTEAGCGTRDHVLNIAKRIGYFGVTTAQGGVIQTTAVLFATGAAPLRLDVPGAALLDRGMSYSIATYAPYVAGQAVAVIGSTSRALLGTMELANIAQQVYLIVPRPDDLATPLGYALRQHPAVQIFAGYEVAEIFGLQRVEELVLRGHGETRRLSVRHAFVDLGLVPRSALVQKLVQTNQRGFVVVDEHNATTLPGLFAAGDVTTQPGEQVLAAIGDGARAAMSAHQYIMIQRLAQREVGG